MVLLKEILLPWLTDTIPDTIVLGCTHYPLIKDEIAKVLARPIHFVDSGEAIGRRVKAISEELVIPVKSQAQKSRAYCTRLDVSVTALQASFSHYEFSEILLLDI